MDAIPNKEFSVECPNPKCKHMNLPYRRLCVICGNYLQPLVEHQGDIDGQETSLESKQKS